MEKNHQRKIDMWGAIGKCVEGGGCPDEQERATQVGQETNCTMGKYICSGRCLYQIPSCIEFSVIALFPSFPSNELIWPPTHLHVSRCEH